MQSGLSDREIARLAPLFSPSTLETVALQHFDTSEATTSSLKAAHRENTEAFKRDLLYILRDKGYIRKVMLYPELVAFRFFRFDIVRSY